MSVEHLKCLKNLEQRQYLEIQSSYRIWKFRKAAVSGKFRTAAVYGKCRTAAVSGKFRTTAMSGKF